MNPLVFHIVSGDVFFTGIMLLEAAVIASLSTHKTARRLVPLGLIFGLLAIVVSSTPVPHLQLGVAIALTAVWLFLGKRPRARTPLTMAVVVAWLTLAGVEISNRFPQTLRPVPGRTVTILGDSVTAGIDGDESSETWPRLLAREHNLVVQDLAHIGETAASALKRLKGTPLRGSIVVVEIGGNDLLGSTTSSQFGRDLDALLAELSREPRQLIMFELPLPPFYHEFGRHQRQLAARYGVRLIPRRVFLSVLAGSGSTLDSIHLSQAGHRLMAKAVWQILQPAFP